jgi:hypothetical protein
MRRGVCVGAGGDHVGHANEATAVRLRANKPSVSYPTISFLTHTVKGLDDATVRHEALQARRRRRSRVREDAVAGGRGVPRKPSSRTGGGSKA